MASGSAGSTDGTADTPSSPATRPTGTTDDGAPGLASCAEQRRGHDRDPVRASVRLAPGRDDDGVQEVAADPLAQPAQVPDVGVVGRGRQLDLDGENPSVVAHDDDVDLAFPPVGTQVVDPSLEAASNYAVSHI